MKTATIISIFFLTIYSMVSSFAQPIDPPCDNDDPTADDCPENIPFDGGASILIAGGASLLGIRAYKKRKI
jgi:hypothetical protein